MEGLRRAAARAGRAWRALESEQRLAACAALGLVAAMFLPWYEKSTIPPGAREFVHESVSAFGTVSFVEAAVLLVALAVLALLFCRGERRAFHLPGGDGTVVLGAGLWAALLIFYRVFDRPGVGGRGSTVGIEWGFFVAFVAAAALAYAGARMRAAHEPEPPLPSEEPPTVRRPRRPPPGSPRRPRPPASPERPLPGQLSFDEAETRRVRE